MNTAVLAQPPGATVPTSLSDEALARESLRAQAALRRRKWVIIGLRRGHRARYRLAAVGDA